MKKTMSVVFLIGLFFVFHQPLLPQEEKQEEEQTPQEEISARLPDQTAPSYSPAGRKDPFRDLLAQQEKKMTGEPKEGPQLSIDNIELIGIVQARGRFTAIITGPQEFPLFVKVGHKFSDGFVLSIDDSKVVLRKTSERGVPLYKPKDIVKEIKAEEIRIK